MKRRTFLIGAGSTAIGGAALVSSGAFSRVESNRDVSVQVTNDANAYLGLQPGDSLNGDNYVAEDESGHVEIDIGEIPEAENPIGGSGVNSNSLTFFDNLLTVCNQGTEDAAFFIDADGLETGDAEVVFYVGSALDGGDDTISSITDADGVSGFAPAALELGECINVGLLVDTGAGSDYTNAQTVDANQSGPLVDGEVTIVADVDTEAGDAVALLSGLDIDGQGPAAVVGPSDPFDVAVSVTNTGRRPAAFGVTFDISRDRSRGDVRNSLFETGTAIADDDVGEPANTKIGFGQVDASAAYDGLTAD